MSRITGQVDLGRFPAFIETWRWRASGPSKRSIPQHTNPIPAAVKERWVAHSCGLCKGAVFFLLASPFTLLRRVADLRSAASAQHTRSIPATTKERWVPRPCGSCKGAGFSCLTPYHGWFTKAARYDSLLVIQSICERDRQEPRHSRRNPCFSRDASANPNPFRLPRGRRNARGFPARVSHGHA